VLATAAKLSNHYGSESLAINFSDHLRLYDYHPLGFGSAKSCQRKTSYLSCSLQWSFVWQWS